MTTPTTEATATTDAITQRWSRPPGVTSANWWTCKPVIRELNRRVCGKTSPTPSHGLLTRVLQLKGDQELTLGVSIGCGSGLKEIDLIKADVVRRMRAYDLTPRRIAHARNHAKRQGVTDRIEFLVGDAFAGEEGAAADLIYWDNSLHHMFDVRAAVEWSFNQLRSGGLFVMNEYVGPTRFDLPEEDLRFVNRVREPLPDRLFAREGRRPLPKRLSLDWLKASIADDPSEMADCGDTLAIVQAFFPDADVVRTGGLAYFVAMSGLYGNVRPDESQDDAALIYHLMLLDDMYTRLRPESTLYAVAIARKP